MMDEIEVAITADIKWNIDWTHSKENQWPWPRKTMDNLWFVHSIDMSAIMEALKDVKNMLTD